MAASSKYDEDKPDTQSVDLTVELNREQRGQVTAVRYPATRKIETIPAPTEDSKARIFTSQITHNVEPPSSRHYSYSSQPSSPQLRHKNMPPTTVYRAVDIPFDESPAAYQPKKDENLHTITVVMGTHPVQKGLGFTITIERGRPTIDSVVVGTPADRAGLLIGDRVISVNGEELKDKYPSAINRLLHDAARLGEAEVVVERKDASRADHPSAREYNSLPRSTSTGAIPRRDNSVSSARSKASSPARSYYESSTYRSEYRSQTNGGTPDYRVTSMHERAGPGKLTDFVPEVERNITKSKDEERREFSYRRASDEEPRLIRNYDLPPAHTTTAKVTSSVTVICWKNS
ncbi:PDZ/DHR/GLGF domain protein [Ancylostoma caninum]|uniref:PDZ/DHR/GLGF domain protein n=1 Tax=Ancylostoma caninum TaxID=29170 RepID=A0A368GXR7_ANCCA|nr:PDZ/DHR/GLGF domain protein [Ancylostoma caninum]